ncbi:MAG: exodeoxyribonuclease VII large subunit [Lentimicrobium sp.]|nr:exodeoxyribonuclease VII large subunit [Lentimicrobium sp.]
MHPGETYNQSRQVFSLSEITESIARMFGKYYTSPYWIRAEISKLNYYPASGHCFPDLVEKQEGKVKAQLRSIIWRDDLFRISQKFEEVTKEPLREGIAIMFQAYVKFTSEHGLSLQIIDIEPLYTLGEMARAKLATIERLKKEGIFNQNKQVPLPLLLKRLAIISAETSKGYNDLLVTLNNNQWGYKFITRLFPALLQGDAAVESLRKQLVKIRSEIDSFDVVLIIRGGGDEVGLACYDHYDLAQEVSLFPIPVITGIGHSTNETVVEMVACVNKITPTDVAHFILGTFRAFDDRLLLAQQLLLSGASGIINSETAFFNELVLAFQQAGKLFVDEEHETLAQMAQAIRESVNIAVFNHRIALSRYETAVALHPDQLLSDRSNILENIAKMLVFHNRHMLSKQLTFVDGIEQRVRLLDPVNVLKRGFTITRYHGKSISRNFKPEPGSVIETETVDEKLISVFTERKLK